MKKIILSTLICLSINLSAQVIPIDMSKITEISEEEKQKKYFKELFEDFKLTHNENAPLITEEQCFEQAYEELKRTPITPDTNNLNSQFKGYDNQIKGLTKFTNSHGRGMSCKNTTIFYIMDAVNAVKKVNSSNIKREEKIEKIISNAKTANEIAKEKFRAKKEEKEFNSNPKNFPYKETWYDYEKGIYELNLIEVEGKEREEVFKNSKVKFEKCEYHGKKFNSPFHILKFDNEELLGFAISIMELKLKKIKINFGNSNLSKFNDYFEVKYFSDMGTVGGHFFSRKEKSYKDFSLYFDSQYKLNNISIYMNVMTLEYIDVFNDFKFQKYAPSTSFIGGSKNNTEGYIIIINQDCVSMNNVKQMENNK